MPPRLCSLGPHVLRPRPRFPLPRRIEACRRPRYQFRRDASSSTGEVEDKVVGRWVTFAVCVAAATTGVLWPVIYGYIADTRRGYQQWAQQHLVVPALRLLCPDAETAHHVGNAALRALWTLDLHPREGADADADGDLSAEVRAFPRPATQRPQADPRPRSSATPSRTRSASPPASTRTARSPGPCWRSGPPSSRSAA